MAVLSDYVSGTISLTNGEVDFTGDGTAWQLAQIREGDTIFYLPGTAFQGVISEITSNVAGKLDRAWEGPDLTDVPYRIRQLSDGSRATSQSAMLREQLGNGNVQALAGLTGANDHLAVFTGPGSMRLAPKSEFINGVAVDKRLNTMAERAAYDAQPDQYSVYIANVGDAFGAENAGRAATFFRAGDTPGVWSDPAFVTGAEGSRGWSDVRAKVVDGERRVEQLVDWVGGEGVKPGGIGKYFGPTGLVDTMAEATDVRGPKGLDGTGTGTLTAVIQGAGIAVDNSDPAQPVVSALGKGSNIASAAALLLPGDGNYHHVTGTASITSIGPASAGSRLTLVFLEALTLSHNAASLILPTRADIVTTPNDTTTFVSEGAGNWRCVSYQRSDGRSVKGGEWTTFFVGVCNNTASFIDITGIPADAQEVEIVVSGLLPAVNTNIFARYSEDGVTFASTAYYYTQIRALNGSAITSVGADNDSGIALTPSISTTAPTKITIRLSRPGDNNVCELEYSATGRANTGVTYSCDGGGQRNASAPVGALRLYTGSGNLVAGRVVGRFFR